MSANKATVEYASRESLDGELSAAIEDILSAEAEARRIIAQAENSVKAIQLDGATRERDMRAAAVSEAARNKEKAVEDAAARAEEECENMRAEAQKHGAALVANNRKNIEKLATELLKSLQ